MIAQVIVTLHSATVCIFKNHLVAGTAKIDRSTRPKIEIHFGVRKASITREIEVVVGVDRGNQPVTGYWIRMLCRKM